VTPSCTSDRAMVEYQDIVNSDVAINRYDGEILKLDVFSEVRFGEYSNPKASIFFVVWWWEF
jgi:hypothetical protein